MIKAWILITVLERHKLTRQTLESIYRTEGDKPGLIVVDNGSTSEVRDYLVEEFKNGKIQRLLFNKLGSVAQWHKSYNINQAYNLIRFEKDWKYFGWVDNDMKMRPSWLRNAITTLKMLDNVQVVSCMQDERQEKSHPTQLIIPVLGVGDVRLKSTANGAAWVMRREFFDRYGLPRVGVGKCNEGVEDWYYSYKLRKEGDRFAVIDAGEHIGYGNSKRADVPRSDNAVQ